MIIRGISFGNNLMLFDKERFETAPYFYGNFGMLLDVLILSPQQIIFEGKARSVILPGEEGFFEIVPLHKRIISRLLSGKIYVDEKSFAITRGLMKAGLNKVTVIVEGNEP